MSSDKVFSSSLLLKLRVSACGRWCAGTARMRREWEQAEVQVGGEMKNIHQARIELATFSV
jgi:hypothetical protein